MIVLVVVITVVQSVLNSSKKATENASNKLNCCVVVAYNSVCWVMCLYQKNSPCRSVMIGQAVFASALRSYRNHLGKLSLGPLIKLVQYQVMKNHSPYSLYQWISTFTLVNECSLDCHIRLRDVLSQLISYPRPKSFETAFSFFLSP